MSKPTTDAIVLLDRAFEGDAAYEKAVAREHLKALVARGTNSLRNQPELLQPGARRNDGAHQMNTYWTCKCGNVWDLDNSESFQFNYFSLALWDDVVAAAAKAVVESGATSVDLIRENISDSLVDFVDQFYKCANCGRVLIFRPSSGDADLYRLEDSYE